MKKTLFFLVSALFIFLLFWGGPGSFSSRSMAHAWNLGHVVCFAFWVHGLSTMAWFRRAGFAKQLLLATIFSVTMGGAIEVLQGYTHRDPDLFDVGRDLGGGLVALAWVAPRHGKWTMSGRLGLRACGLFLLGICVLPLAGALLDETMARWQFPLLADFENPLELTRWKGDAQFALDADQAASGRRSLKVSLAPGRYSGIALRYFPGNWLGFTALRFSVFNPAGQPLRLTCRIHDQLHEKAAQEFRDRFNRTLVIAPGWNDISIPLREVAAAPKGRTMDLARLRQVGIFASRLPEPRAIYLDSVRLVR